MIVKFKTLQELLKSATEIQSAQMLLKNGTGRLVQCRFATNLQFLKSAISAKHNKGEHNKQTAPVL